MVKVTLRPATAGDEAMLLRWRNDPATRRNSIRTGPVSAQTHSAWLSGVLGDPATRLFIAQCDGAAAGTVRAQLLDGGATELSWTVAPEMRGRGVGKAMVKRALMYLSGTVVARIKAGNEASESIALSAGFEKTGSEQGVCIWTIEKTVEYGDCVI